MAIIWLIPVFVGFFYFAVYREWKENKELLEIKKELFRRKYNHEWDEEQA